MEEKKFKLFREKNLAKIESPEALDDYLQVTSPSVWLVLATVAVFLIGVCVWGIFGHIDSSVKVAVIADNEGEAVCLVPEKALTSAVEDRLVNVDGAEFELAPETLVPQVISEDTNIYWMLAGDLEIGDIVYNIPLSLNKDGALDEGVYSGSIVTETLSPVSLLLN